MVSSDFSVTSPYVWNSANEEAWQSAWASFKKKPPVPSDAPVPLGGPAPQVPQPSASSTPAAAANAAAKGGGIWGAIKGFFRFLNGDWAAPLGEAYKKERAAAKAIGQDFGITKFDWKKGYKDYYEKKAADAARKAAGGVVETAKKGFLSKLGGFVMKGFQILILYQGVMAVINGYKEGGLSEAIKEGLKYSIGFVGISLGTLVATICGAGTIGVLAAGLLGQLALDFCGKKVLGASIAEQKQKWTQENASRMVASNSGSSTASGNTSKPSFSSSSGLDPKIEKQIRSVEASIDNAIAMAGGNPKAFSNRNNIFADRTRTNYYPQVG